MKRLTMGLVTVLVGTVVAACGATPATTTGEGTGSTSATTGAGTGSTSATTSATTGAGTGSTSATTSATTGAGAGATTRATTGAGAGATTSATTGAGAGATTSATTGAGAGATTSATTGAGAGATTSATSGAGAGATTGATTGAGTGATTSATTGAGTGATTSATSGAGAGATSAAGSEVDSLLAVAGEQGNLTTLLTALQVTGLDQQLNSLGSYTLFAPSDEAFAALPSGALEALLLDPALLGQILSYHVSEQNLKAADITSASSVTTLEGQAIQVSASGGKVTLNGNTNVTTTDIETTNGTIHLIDKVLLPPNVTLPTS